MHTPEGHVIAGAAADAASKIYGDVIDLVQAFHGRASENDPRRGWSLGQFFDAEAEERTSKLGDDVNRAQASISPYPLSLSLIHSPPLLISLPLSHFTSSLSPLLYSP